MTSKGRLVAALLVVVGVLAGCSGGDDPASGDAGAGAQIPATPDAAFAALEAALREDGPAVRIGFDVVAEGVVTVDLTGTLLLGDAGRARLEARGSFAGNDVDISLISDGRQTFWTGNEVGAATPPALRDALGVGFTRMGILHNLARLSSGSLPDRADGGVDTWVTLTPTDDSSVLEGAPTGEIDRAVVRALSVAGRPSGIFSLAFDGRTPLVRRQRVDFPEGIMQVTERYRSVEFDPSFPPGSFDTTPLDPSR
ncbi:MAG: hypothetical protein RQ745_05275 [Longimicrobiales bacterium]|nr:hypothetical protein [Longimicrobiales bacterium]